MEKFAFIIHPIDVRRDAARKYPPLRFLPTRAIEKLMEKMSPKLASHVVGVESPTGARAEGWLVVCPLSPRQFLDLPSEMVYDKIAAAGKLGAAQGAKIVGLGASTSVVGDAGISVAKRLEGTINVTSGNSYTVYTALEGLLRAAEMMGVDIPTARLAVIGANGAIGAVCARMMAETVGDIALVGRDRDKLETLRASIASGATDNGDSGGNPKQSAASNAFNGGAANGNTFNTNTPKNEISTGDSNGGALNGSALNNGVLRNGALSESALSDGALSESALGDGASGDGARMSTHAAASSGRRASVWVADDIKSALRDADLVLAVSAATDALIFPEDLKSGAVVCDVARPRDVSRRVVEERDDVLVIEGGVIAVPGPVNFNFNFGFPDKTAYACMSETMLMALEGTYEPYTLGRDLTVAQVRRIGEIARRHDFKLAGFRAFERAVSDETIAQVRRAAQHRALRQPVAA